MAKLGKIRGERTDHRKNKRKLRDKGRKK